MKNPTWLVAPAYGLVLFSIIASTTQSRADLESMRARVPDVLSLKEKGCVGEKPDGLLGVAEECPNAKAVVDAENQDRLAVYKERAPKEHGLEAFQLIMGAARIKKEPAGRKVMKASGEWVKKKTDNEEVK